MHARRNYAMSTFRRLVPSSVGGDDLPVGLSIKPGEVYTFSVPAALYDVQVRGKDGKEVDSAYGQEVSGDYRLSLGAEEQQLSEEEGAKCGSLD